ncbi:MAG TPA: DUF6717 family protein [Candidatus Eisenbacteria bacterium]
MNALTVLTPYKNNGMWVFDDDRTGLVREPFIMGIPRMIDRVVADIPNAAEGFNLIFSATRFPGAQLKLEWRRADGGGNWYWSADDDMEGWLCPALFRYFDEAPKEIHVRVEAKG